jgi:hypothetical protein
MPDGDLTRPNVGDVRAGSCFALELGVIPK